MVNVGPLTDFIVMACRTLIPVHSVHKRSKLWITCLSTVSSIAGHGFKPSDIFFYLSSPRIVPCLLLLGGAPLGSRSLKPGEKASMPLSGWLLGRFGGNAIGASTKGRPLCRWLSRQWLSRQQSSTKPGLGHA
jgi:hypothetical protein